MALQDYTDEQLRAELRRRNEQRIAERKKIARCRDCKHMMQHPQKCHRIICNVREYGKNGKHYTVTPSQLACELFERKEDE